MTIEFVCLEDLIQEAIDKKMLSKNDENPTWRDVIMTMLVRFELCHDDDDIVQIYIGLPIKAYRYDKDEHIIVSIGDQQTLFGRKIKQLSSCLVKRCQELTGLNDHNFALCVSQKGIPLLGAFK